MFGDEAFDCVCAERACPRRDGNSGSPGSPPCSASQARTVLAVWLVSGVTRSLRPLPWQQTCAPCPRPRSWILMPVSLGYPQAGLDGQVQQGVVAAAPPGGAVGRGQQRFDLVLGEVADDGAVGAFGGDGQYPLDEGGVFGALWNAA